MRTLLISTYELGRQPFGLASPAAWLRDAGVEVDCLDLSREPFRPELAAADLVAFHLPMHTATRLAVPVIRQVRELYPAARLCCYGIYAPLNASFLRSLGVHDILGGEFEDELVRLAERRPARAANMTLGEVPRLQFRVPDRNGLPPPSRYATLQHGSDQRVVGYTEGKPGVQAQVPALSDRTGLRRAVPGGPGRGRARRYPSAGGARSSARDLWRPGFLQRDRSCHPCRRRCRAPVSRPDLRRHDQGRASSSARRSVGLVEGHGLRVRDERLRIVRRSCTGRITEGAHAGRRASGRRALPGRRVGPGAYVCGVHAVDDGRGLLRSAERDRPTRSCRPGCADSAGDPSTGA